MPVSTTQILLGLVLLAIVAGLGAFCFAHSGDDDGLEATILSPENGGEYASGPVVVRIRASGGREPPRWELAYRALDGEGEWVLMGEGDYSVAPRNIGRGLDVLELSDPGNYELRLVVENIEGTERLTDTVRFTVVP